MSDEQTPSEIEDKSRVLMKQARSGFFAALVGAALMFSIVFLVPGMDWQYGLVLFGVVPFVAGFTSAMLLGHSLGASWRRCAVASMWSLLFAGVGILIFAVEGIICVLMSLPIVLPMLLIGAWAGWALMKAVKRRGEQRISVIVAIVVVPMLLNHEEAGPHPLVHHCEASSIVIAAPPRLVWKYVCSTRQLPKANELLFRAGFAHPKDIELLEPKLGGKRVCRLSTGPMPEIVDVWEPGKRLGFHVLETPPSMEETGLYGKIETVHLTGYFICERGEFRLEALPGGQTMVTGTSWYANRVAPDFYWHLWTDSIVEAVHNRVLGEIKRRAESEATLSRHP